MSDEPTSTTPEAAFEPGRGVPAGAAASLGETLRSVAVAASIGAAVVHFAFAPSHFDEQTSHGVFFVAVGWLQVMVALALSRWRARPEPWLGAAALNGAVLAVWLGSRTVGVPRSQHDAVGFPDALASGLEVVVVACAAVALRTSLSRRPVPRRHPLVGSAAALVLVALVSAALTPSLGGEEIADHEHDDTPGESAAGGHDHGPDVQMASAARQDRCDLGFNTVVYNNVAQPGMPMEHDDAEPVDFTIEQWADVFVDPARGIPPEAVVGYLEDNPTLRDGVLSGGLTHMLAPDPWIPMTDPAECEQLAGELEQAREVIARYPTISDAEAAGYRKVTQYYPGIAAHYIKTSLIDEGFTLDEPEMLLYDGDGPTAHIVGLSYYIVKEGDDEPTVGFTGPNDHYHRHVGLCFRSGVVVAGSNTSDQECAAEGGRKNDGTAGWMSHLWLVPGCESEWGLFSGANPALVVRGLDTTGEVPMGCGTNRSLDDRLGFDTEVGDGPRL
jgi:hypothetical protein